MGSRKIRFIAIAACVVSLALGIYRVPQATSAEAAAPSKESVREVLKEFAPDVMILSVEKTPIEGLWEVAVSMNGGNKSVMYLDSAKKYLVQGAIVNLATKVNLTQEKFDEINKVDISKVPLQGSIIVGDPKAKNRIFVFTDPDCPYCIKFHDEIKKVIEKRKDIVFYVKLFPLSSIHPKAREKSMAIICEKDNDKAVKMLEDAYAKKDIPKAACTSPAVDETVKLGQSLGVQGTPTIIFADGKIRHGMSAEEVMTLVDAGNR
ncbi:MAG TPA: DsbC family protein [Nitrospirota bacterium]|nr:DsbC family protein [Nitrospirota bacterium]